MADLNGTDDTNADLRGSKTMTINLEIDPLSKGEKIKLLREYRHLVFTKLVDEVGWTKSRACEFFGMSHSYSFNHRFSERSKLPPSPYLRDDTPPDELSLSVRALNALANHNVGTLGQMKTMDVTKLLTQSKVGKGTVREIEDFITASSCKEEP